MADTIGEAFVAIRPDTTGFQREAETGLKSGIGKLAAGIGGLFIGQKIGQGLSDAINAGSDLNETVNKTTVVFGDSSKAALAYGDTAASSLGESKQAALEQLSTLGNLFVSLGLGRGKALDMGKGMVSLAADLGSFNNVPTDEALEAIRSGLVGETEPLRRFGVNMNEATLKAKALELGISDGTAQLTPAQRAQAAYALILEQTTTAQGDFARTSDGAANQQKILAARMEDIKAKIGTALLPIYTKLLGIGQKVITWLSEHKTVAKALAVVIGGVLVGAVYAWVASMVTAAAATIAATWPVLAIIAAVAALAAGIYLLVTNWDEVWAKIKEIAASVWEWLTTSFFGKIIIYGIFPVIGAIKFLAENWGTIWGAITTVAQAAWDNVLGPIFGFIVDRVNNTITLLGWLRAGFEIAWPAISGAIQAAWDIMNPILSGMIDAIRTVIGWVKKALDAVDSFKSQGGTFFPGFPNLPIVPHFASGGFVGGSGNRDTVPAMLTPGEYVMSKAEVAASKAGGDHVHLHYERMPRNGVQIAVEAFQGLRAARQAAAL